MASQYTGGAVQVGPRLDRLPICGFHWNLLLLIAGGLCLDSFDIYIGGSVLGTLVKEGWSTLELNAWFVTMTFVGLVIGAWSAGLVGDRYGRRVSYQLNLAIFGLASFAAAFAPSMYVLILLRFIMGIGLGAELVIGYGTFAEFVPPSQRGRMVGILACASNSTVFFAALISLWVIPTLGWRALFALVGVLAVVVWFARKAMPESPRWLESKGRLAEADAIVATMEARAARTRPLPPVGVSAAAAETSPPLSALFGPAHLRSTIVGSVVMVVIGISIYGFVGWLPTFFVKQGHSIVTSLSWSMIMSLGGPTGALIGLFLADRFGRKPLLVTFAVLAALIGVIYHGLASDSELLFAGFCLVTTLYTIVVVGQAIYVPELFPTNIRMRGTGVCSTAGRLTSAVIQFIIIAIFNLGGISDVIMFVVAALVLLAGTVAIFGRETAKAPLEVLHANS
ncbi:MAG: transporter, putative metabolite:H+ symporter [Acetobacteraceae bacterium]|nr:hypothetical protein [Gammaproteobacteria bacterium]MEA2730786.1 transporter, putative metabolite:H+ symporter [Acetobacteraceae bacterium]